MNRYNSLWLLVVCLNVICFKSMANQATASAESFKFNGYIDFRLSTVGYKEIDTNGNAESGFLLDDGAFYLDFKRENVSIILDLPFRRAKSNNISNDSNVLFGADKMQAYAKVKTDYDFLTFNLGQFDTPYGVELNDSKDRFFGKTGIIYDKFYL